MAAPIFNFLVITCLLTISINVTGRKHDNTYLEYFIEDVCNFFIKQNFILYSYGNSAAVKIKATRMAKPEANKACSLFISTPNPYGVILHVEDFNFGFGLEDQCLNYLEVQGDYGNVTRICGALKDETMNFFTKGNATLRYYREYQDNFLLTPVRERFTIVATAYTRDCYYSTPNVFKCNNGLCIWNGFTCDGVNNCGDNSDENHFGRSKCAMMPESTTKSSIWDNKYTFPPTSWRNMNRRTLVISVATPLTIICIVLLTFRLFCLFRKSSEVRTRSTRTVRRRVCRFPCPPDPPPPYTILVNDGPSPATPAVYAHPPPYTLMAPPNQSMAQIPSATQPSSQAVSSEAATNTVTQATQNNSHNLPTSH